MVHYCTCGFKSYNSGIIHKDVSGDRAGRVQLNGLKEKFNNGVQCLDRALKVHCDNNGESTLKALSKSYLRGTATCSEG